MSEDHFFCLRVILLYDNHFIVGGSFFCRRIILMSEDHFNVGGSF